MTMTNNEFKKILTSFINESFPGTNISEFSPSGGQRNPVVYNTPQKLSVLSITKDVKLILSRSQKFKKLEKTFIESYIELLSSLEELDKKITAQVTSKLLGNVVAKTINSEESVYNLLLSMIDRLEVWSTETYEGGGIAASFLLDATNNETDGVQFNEYAKQDFAKVMSNGYDTIAAFSSNGNLLEYKEITDYNPDNYKTPFRYSGICELTAENQKIALILNRNGEILIFTAGELKFARRRGSWVAFVHDTVIEKLSFGSKYIDDSIKQAMYATALDVSFARVGGSITLLKKTFDKRGFDDTVDIKDHLNNTGKIKSLALKSFYNTELQQVDRRIRQEIAGIDGATIIDSEGRLIVAGAIISVSFGSDEGARSASTKKLSKYGVSMKISADGKISAFKDEVRKFVFA